MWYKFNQIINALAVNEENYKSQQTNTIVVGITKQSLLTKLITYILDIACWRNIY